MDTNKKIGELVRKNEQDFMFGTTTISKYVDFSLNDNINKIDAYLNSKHTTGESDSMGREKPFFNICTSAVNIWYRATDLDRKNIQVKATKESDIFTAYLATVHLQNWMRKDNFGTFLNEWGRTLARYGSAVVKFIENDEGLHSMVIPWNRLIVDQIDFSNDAVIEILELTPAQLKERKGYDQEIVNQLIDAVTERETSEKQKKDSKSNFIKLYEVHGNLPLSYLTGREEDDKEFVQQMHVISFVAKKKRGEFDDYTLIKGKEAKHPYMITHLIKEDGRTQSIGAVEHLFEAQWMMNHTVKAIKDQLDLASKLIFQTSDGNFVGQNALNAIETGDILIHAVNQPLTQVANTSHDVTSLQNFGSQWKALGNEINGITESMMGNTAPSGTAWRQVETLLQESHSLFELMTENKGLHLEEMLRTYVIPYLKKQMDNTDQIRAAMSDYGMDKIEKRFIKNKSILNQKEEIKDALLNNKPIPDTTLEEHAQAIQQSLAEQGTERFIKPSDIPTETWKEIFKDLEWELEVDITGEQKDTANAMTTINSLLMFFARKQGQPLTPEESLLVNKTLTMTGAVSPLELSNLEKPVAQMGGQMVGAGQELPVNQPQNNVK